MRSRDEFDDSSPPDAATMQTTVTVQCPYCFETVDVWIDPMDEGEMIRDCDVCCRPWRLIVTRHGSGEQVDVQVHRAGA